MHSNALPAAPHQKTQVQLAAAAAAAAAANGSGAGINEGPDPGPGPDLMQATGWNIVAANGTQAPMTEPSQQNPNGAISALAGNMIAFSGMAGLRPLDKSQFENAFKSYCTKRDLKIDARSLTIDNRTVDLHQLHCEMIKEGGSGVVDQKDMWNVIGGRLGFVQFPGSETEPAKCGPGAAQALQNIYKNYLQFFDNYYATRIMEKRIQAQNQLQNQLAATQQVQARPAALMQQLIQMSSLSAAELVARGVDEKTIQFVEAHRANLQRSFTEQKMYQAKMRPALNGAPGGSVMNMGPRSMLEMAGQPHNMIGGLPSQPILSAEQFIRKVKAEFMQRDMNRASVDIPVEQRLEFNNLLEAANRACSDAEGKLTFVYIIFSVQKLEEQMKQLISNICLVTTQRGMLSSSESPRYIVTFENLKDVMIETQRIMELFQMLFAAARNRSQQQHQAMGMNPQMQQQPQSTAFDVGDTDDLHQVTQTMQNIRIAGDGI